MGANSGIAWTDHTFNPWWGCEKVSPACKHCYAETFSNRLGEKLWGPGSSRKMFGDKRWREPLKWNRAAEKAGVRAKVFCASMADVFEDRPELHAPRARLFALISETPWLDWLLLTKRPENFATMLPWMVAPKHGATLGVGDEALAQAAKPWPNVWLGTTAEDQEWADKRVPLLIDAPAVVHFVSAEPLLGALDLTRYMWPIREAWDSKHKSYDAARAAGAHAVRRPQALISAEGAARLVNWVIVGCESGHGARPQNLDHVRKLRDDCLASGTSIFVKQLEEASPPSPVMIGESAQLVTHGPGSWRKGPRKTLIEQPYLDGVQHVQFPTPRTP